MNTRLGLIALGPMIAGMWWLSGCAQVPPDAGFDQVRQSVSQRIDQHVQWRRGEEEDAQAASAVRQLLGQPLTADAAVQVALLNNADLQAEYEDLGVSQADVVQAGLLKNPVFAASVRMPDAPPSAVNREFSVAQDFLDVLMLPARKSITAADFARVRARVGAKVIELAGQTKAAYYVLVGAEQGLKIQRMIVESAEASFDMARRLNEAGNLNDLGLSHEQALYEQTRVDQAKAQAEVTAQREQLSRLMGVWGDQTGWRVPDQLPDIPTQEVPLEHLESLAIGQRLDLDAARRQVQELAQALDLSRKWRYLASGDVGVSTERDTGGQTVTGPNLSLELPVFDQKQATLARLEAQLRQSRQRMSALAVDIRSEVRAARDRLVMARHLAEHDRTVIIPLRERIVSLTQQHYNFMLAGVFQLIAARQDEYDAYRQYVQAVRDYWVAHADLERAVGGRLTTPSQLPSAHQGEQP